MTGGPPATGRGHPGRAWPFGSAGLLAPAPAERLAALRALVFGFGALYLAGRFPHVVDSTTLGPHRWAPVGVLRPLGSPPPAAAVLGLAGLAVPAAAMAALGWRWRLTGPVASIAALVVLTYVNCWGAPLHTENLLVMHLLLLAWAPAADAWAWSPRRRARASPAGAGRRSGSPTPAPAARYGWPVRLVSLVTVLTYALAGWAKVRASGWEWVSGEVLRNHVAHDILRKAVLGSTWSPLGDALVGHGWIWPPIGASALAVELGAPLVLLWRRLRPWWVAAAWAFHVGVLAIMAILFPYPLSGVAFASLFRLERAPARLRAWRRRGRQLAATARGAAASSPAGPGRAGPH